jgi:hypothetical protein
MDKPYFVMLLTRSGKRFSPLFDNDDELMMFADEREAVEAANEAWTYGYEIFCEGCGEKSKP